MEAQDQSNAGAGARAFTRRVVELFKRRMAAMKKRRRYLETVRALNACSTRVLEDNGMTRFDIPDIARRA